MHKGGALPSRLSIKLPQLTRYSKHFNADNRKINFSVTNKKLLKDTMKYGIRLKAYLKKNLK